jgi:hypothetical protein
MLSHLDLGFEAQPRNRPRLHLAVHATMRPALDPAGNRVPRTKPTYLLHTWRPHRRRPFALILHLHQHQSSCNLHLQYLAKNQSIQRCQSLITQGSDHPPVLEPHMVLTWAGCDLIIGLNRFGPFQRHVRVMTLPPHRNTACPQAIAVLMPGSHYLLIERYICFVAPYFKIWTVEYHLCHCF